MKIKEVMQLELAVTDESSAIQWLKINLTKKPQLSRNYIRNL